MDRLFIPLNLVIPYVKKRFSSSRLLDSAAFISDLTSKLSTCWFLGLGVVHVPINQVGVLPMIIYPLMDFWLLSM
jgi:hypothetical protein